MKYIQPFFIRRKFSLPVPKSNPYFWSWIVKRVDRKSHAEQVARGGLCRSKTVTIWGVESRWVNNGTGIGNSLQPRGKDKGLYGLSITWALVLHYFLIGLRGFGTEPDRQDLQLTVPCYRMIFGEEEGKWSRVPTYSCFSLHELRPRGKEQLELSEWF